MKRQSVWQLILLFERGLLLRKFRDAIEASGDDKQLLFLVRIGNYFAERTNFPRMLKPKSDIAKYRGHMYTPNIH